MREADAQEKEVFARNGVNSAGCEGRTWQRCYSSLEHFSRVDLFPTLRASVGLSGAANSYGANENL